MRICPNCGWSNDAEFRFCENCGADLDNVKPGGWMAATATERMAGSRLSVRCHSQPERSGEDEQSFRFGSFQMAPLPAPGSAVPEASESGFG